MEPGLIFNSSQTRRSWYAVHDPASRSSFFNPAPPVVGRAAGAGGLAVRHRLGNGRTLPWPRCSCGDVRSPRPGPRLHAFPCGRNEGELYCSCRWLGGYGMLLFSPARFAAFVLVSR